MSGISLFERLEARSIEPAGFGHREHLQAAYELLEREPFLDAAVRYTRAIDGFARSVGAADKFNLTVTLAFLSLIAERMAALRLPGFDAFLESNPDLLADALGSYYSRERLYGTVARNTFLLPDVGVGTG